MKTRLLIILAIGLIGFSGTAFAMHDPTQSLEHSIILPPEMKEATFDEFMEWCMPYYGEKCVEFEKERIPIILSPPKQFESEISVIEKQVRYNIPYVISNGMIDDVVLDCEAGSLLLDISSNSKDDVNLDIELPRNLLDPKTNGEDSQFFILRDGDEIDYAEIPYNDYRRLSMSLPPNTDKIEIIHAFILALKPPMCKVVDSPPYSYILPPLKQFKLGIPTNEIHCRDGLTMLLSPKDSRPVCVTGDTAEKLIPRNWGIIVSRG